MYHLHLGEDPHWSLYHHRERLVFTDPPAAAQPRSQHNQARRGAHAVILTLVIAAVLHAGINATPTSHPSRDTDIPTLPNHTKEALR